MSYFKDSGYFAGSSCDIWFRGLVKVRVRKRGTVKISIIGKMAAGVTSGVSSSQNSWGLN